MCYSERGSVLPLLHPRSSDPVRILLPTYSKGKTVGQHNKLSVLLMSFGPTSTSSIFLGFVLVSEISPPTTISGTRMIDFLHK